MLSNAEGTYYINGFQYSLAAGKGNQPILQFFPTAEGYVNVTEGTAFNYVYNYTDHLGNVRLSYQKEANGSLKVLEENNYYPFGLKHSGYNNTNLANTNYKYKYQGQERQDELGLNWDSFKWRNYDPAIGRFFNIDPLAEQYAYNSTYAFSENRVIDSRELEGLEKVLFQGALKNDKLFNRAYEAQRQTTKGKEFSQNLKSQNKYNVLYAPFTKGIANAWTIKNKNQKEFEENIDRYGLYIKKDDYNLVSDNGEKDVLIIAVSFNTKKKRDNIDNKEAFELAGSIGHEEVAHGNNELIGKPKSVYKEHKDFYGRDSYYSPSKNDVLTKEEFKGTEARQLFMELLKILNEKK